VPSTAGRRTTELARQRRLNIGIQHAIEVVVAVLPSNIGRRAQRRRTASSDFPAAYAGGIASAPTRSSKVGRTAKEIGHRSGAPNPADPAAETDRLSIGIGRTALRASASAFNGQTNR